MSNHFEEITPEQRWRNDLLNEQRKTNELLTKLIERNAQTLDTKVKPVTAIKPKPAGRRMPNGNTNRMAKG